MAGSKNLVIRNSQVKHDAYERDAKESLAFRRFLLLGKMATDVGLCSQDVRFALNKYVQWLEPAGRANVAKFAGNLAILKVPRANPTSLFEVKKGARDYELRKVVLRVAIEEAVEDPAQFYGEEGWFVRFAEWLNYRPRLELATLDHAMYAILMAQQQLTNPGLKFPSPVQGRVKLAWWVTFRMFSNTQLELCTCQPVAQEQTGNAIFPKHHKQMQELTDLMDSVFALVDPSIERSTLCEESPHKPSPINDVGFITRWKDLLSLLL